MSETIDRLAMQKAGPTDMENTVDGSHVSSSTLNNPHEQEGQHSVEESGLKPELLDEKQKTDATARDKSEGDSSSQQSVEEWTFSTRAQLVFGTLSALALMVSLDGTSISVALPVRLRCYLPPIASFSY